MNLIAVLQLLLLVALTKAFTLQHCPYKYNNTNYEKTTILSIVGLPTNLVVDPNTKNVIFTLIDVDSLKNDDEQTKMDVYVLTNGGAIKISNVNGQSAAIDEDTGRVYIASDNGLHTLNDTNLAEYLTLRNEDIVQLFKPKKSAFLYAVFFPENLVYKINILTHQKEKVEDVPCAYILAVDSDENIYYECNSKYVKVLLKDFHKPIEYVGIQKNSGRAMTVDDNGNVILATNDGVYQLTPDSLIPKKLMSLNYVPSGIDIDGDDLYIASDGAIFKYSNDDCEQPVVEAKVQLR